ncbi:MAG: hypothetical protein ACRD1J_01940, partial [Terriglobia bacterium]
MKMTRRVMAGKTFLAATAALLTRATGKAASFSSSPGALPQSATQPAPKEGLTRYVAEFVVKTQYSDIPENVIELGKKSILDGLGLALAGSVVES